VSNHERVRILADDLTGALDSAAAFAASDNLFPVSWDVSRFPAGSGAIDLATREAGEAAAVTRHERCANWLASADVPFKKVDSLLRGHAAGEIAACFRGGAYDQAVVAPAFPYQGRATRNARQWVGNPPRRVGPDLCIELASLGVRAGSSADTGWRGAVTIFDAETDADLDRIVSAELRPGRRILWVGAGGLAAALARRVAPKSGVSFAAETLSRPLLGLVGTNHPATLAQVEYLRNADQEAVLVIAGGNAAPLIQDRLRCGGLTVLQVETPRNPLEVAWHISEAFSCLLAGLPPPGCLFVTGGETLHGVATALGSHALHLVGAIEPGLPVSRFAGGRFDGVPVISKSGGFGGSDLLCKLSDALKIEVAQI
jgi:uncharacterized protein YgbK (DUF1537 family)